MVILCLTSLDVDAQGLESSLAQGSDESVYQIEKDSLLILTSTGCTLSISSALSAKWVHTSEPYFHSDTKGCFWLRGRVPVSKLKRGSHSDSLNVKSVWMVEAGHHGLNTMYVLDNGTLVDSVHMGNDLPLNKRAYPHVWSKSYLNIAPLEVANGHECELIFKYSNPYGQSLYGTNDELAITFVSPVIVDSDARLHLVFSGLMMGGLLLLFLYQLTQWMVYRTELGITYCFMLLGLMSYIMYDDFLLQAIFADRHVSELWLFVTGSLGLLGFFRFAQLTLKAVDFVPHRDKVLDILFKVKLTEVLVYLLLATFASTLWSRQLAAFVPETFRVLLLVTLLVFSYIVISHFRENKDATTRAFMLGNISLVTGVMIVTTQVYLLPFVDLFLVKLYLNIIWPFFDYIIEAGIVGMALCFAFAVAMLTKDREVKIERAYSRRLVDGEMKALRAQMNPHFLFNGLNSIKGFVIDNKRHEAAEYLSKFARLIRRILENSNASLIPLSRELETLEYYLEMETMRFGDHFSYAIDIDEELSVASIQVPPTLIQPFVENSIWHGLLPKTGEACHIDILVRKSSESQVQLIVEDNGIGREASAARRVNLPTKRKSLGMEITAERIAMLKELHGFSAELEVIDLKDEHQRAIGTRVVITLDQARELLLK